MLVRVSVVPREIGERRPWWRGETCVLHADDVVGGSVVPLGAGAVPLLLGRFEWHGLDA